ncbi:MAG: hypothetical protein ACTSW1_18480 [Candidatus Hodarchaeales archaeon]
MNYNCLECGGNLIQTETNIVCTKCGLVVTNLFEKPTALLLNTDKNYKNQYTAISEKPDHIKTLGTYVGSYRRQITSDMQGHPLKISAKRQYRRLKTLNDIYVHFDGRQREYRCSNLLNSVCGLLEITTSTKADALYLFKTVQFQLIKELKLSKLVFGALYLALRSRKENIELSRLVKVIQKQGFSIQGKDIIKAASLIRQNVKLRVSHVKSEEYLENIICTLQRDSKIINKIKNKIAVDEEEYFQYLRISAKKIFSFFPSSQRGGRNPFILSAAVIVASDILLAQKKLFPSCYKRTSKRGILTQKYISQILNIAEFTLREHYLLVIKPLVFDKFYV